MSYKWISPQGEVIKTKTIAEFARNYGFRYSNAKSLACGHYQTLHGWLSPKAPKKRRKRFTTVLVNTRTGAKEIVGQSITSFAERHGVCANDLWKVINGYDKLMAKDWVLERTLDAALSSLADRVG